MDLSRLDSTRAEMEKTRVDTIRLDVELIG